MQAYDCCLYTNKSAYHVSFSYFFCCVGNICVMSKFEYTIKSLCAIRFLIWKTNVYYIYAICIGKNPIPTQRIRHIQNLPKINKIPYAMCVRCAQKRWACKSIEFQARSSECTTQRNFSKPNAEKNEIGEKKIFLYFA